MKATINKISTDLGIATYGTFEKRMEKAVAAQLAFDEAEKESKALNTKIETLRGSIESNSKITNEDKIKLEKEQKELATLQKSAQAVERNLDAKEKSKSKAIASSQAALEAFHQQYPDKPIGADSLHQAAIIGDKELFNAVEAAGMDINKKDEKGLTPLHYAAQYGRTEIVNDLLSATRTIPVDRNAVGPEPDKQTPLHMAIANGENGIADTLIFQNSDINIQDAKGLTPLHHAVQKGMNDVAGNLIQNNKKALNIKDVQGLTPIDYIMKEKNEDFLTYVLDRIPDFTPNATPERSDIDAMGTYFNSAVQNGNKAFAEKLLEKYSYASTVYSYKGSASALHIAAKNGDADMVDFIIKHNSSPEKVAQQFNNFPYDTQEPPQLQQDAKGNTALHEAVNGGKGEIVELLLNAITDPEKKAEYLKAVNNKGVPAINMAAEQGNRAVYEALEKAYGAAFVQTQECTNLRTQLAEAEKKKQEETQRAEQEKMKQAALSAAPSIGGGANQASQQSNGQSQSQFDPSKPVWREKMQPDGKAIIGDTTQGHFVQSRNDQGKFDYVMTNAEKDNNRYVLKIPSKPAGEFDEIVYQNGQIVDVKSEAKNSQLSDNMKKQIEDYKSKLTGVSVAIEKNPTPQARVRTNSNAPNPVSTAVGSNPVEQDQGLVAGLKNKIETSLQNRGAPNTTGQASQTQDAPPTSPQQVNPLKDLLSGRKVVVKTGTNISQVPEEEMKKALEPILPNGPSSQPQTISDQPVSPSPQVRDSAGRIKQTIIVEGGKTKTVWETPEQTTARESAAKMQKGFTDQAISNPAAFEQQRKKSQNLIRPQGGR